MVTASREDLIPESIRDIALVRPLTAKDLTTFPDDGNRYEIIGGVLVVSPAPTTRHQRILTQLVTWMNLYLMQRQKGDIFAAPTDVHLSINDVVQPDLVVVLADESASIQERGIIGAPDLIVEILSPSTTKNDRVWKAALYARSGVHEYWLVDPVEETIVVQSLDHDHYVSAGSFGRYEVLESIVLDGFTLDLALIFPATQTAPTELTEIEESQPANDE